MAQGITLRLADPEVSFEPQLLRAIGWAIKEMAEAKYPGLGDLILEIYDTTDFSFGRSEHSS